MPAALGPALLTGFLLALSFPPYHLWVLAWIALVPLLFFTSSSQRSTFFDGWLAGTLYHLILFSWLWKTFHAAGIANIQTFFVWLALAAYMGLYLGIFLLAWSRPIPSGWKPFWAAAVWVSLDFLKTHFLTGFPWGLLAHSQYTTVPVLQIAALTGAAGVTFLIVLVNATLALALTRKISLCAATPGVGVALIVIAVGVWRVQDKKEPTEGISAVLLQGNIDQYEKWDSRFEKEIRETYEKLSTRAATFKPDVIVWPESAVPGWYPTDSHYKAWVTFVVRRSRAAHIIGAVSSLAGHDTNSAFLISSDGELRARYDKRHLVPFGEYIPFGSFMVRWIPYLGQLGTFAAGSGPALFPVKNFAVAPSVCYEMVFPDQIRRDVKAGAQVLVNITNDGWYLDTGAPEQHLMASVFRAVENRRPVMRAANTGISAVIDEKGRFLFRSPLNERGAFLVRVPVSTDTSLTPFTRFGAWFSWLCLLLTLSGALIYWFPHVSRT